MTKSEFIEYGTGVCKQHPQLREDVQDMFELALCEIDDGGSEDHEWELAYGSVEELVEEL